MTGQPGGRVVVAGGPGRLDERSFLGRGFLACGVVARGAPEMRRFGPLNLWADARGGKALAALKDGERIALLGPEAGNAGVPRGMAAVGARIRYYSCATNERTHDAFKVPPARCGRRW